jgi:arginine deiminase
MKLNVTSEIGKLKTVLLHRPGNELENLTPDLMERLLFDDIPFLRVAQAEHDAFAKALHDEGVEVLYIEKMVAEALRAHPEVKEEFINKFISEAKVVLELRKKLYDYLDSKDIQEMVDLMIAGIRNYEIIDPKEIAFEDYPFVCDPLPNVLFQRDPFASMGNGISLNQMRTETRNRETLFSEYMFKYHPRFEDEIEFYYQRDDKFALEGGDELVINDHTLAIGISQRTDFEGIQTLAERLFFEFETNFDTVLAFDIPKRRAFMHLDTVFTQIDYDKFTIHPEIMGTLIVYELTKGDGEVKVTKVEDSLQAILSKHVGRDVELIECGGGDPIISAREQWNDGANTLCVSPGTVIVYERNWVTNDILRSKGIKVIEIPSGELSRGRGGPRCMSMPIIREDI